MMFQSVGKPSQFIKGIELLSSNQLSARYCSVNVSTSNKRIKPKRKKAPKYTDPNYPKRPLNGI